MSPFGTLSRLFRGDAPASSDSTRVSADTQRIFLACVAGNIRVTPTADPVASIVVRRRGAHATCLRVTERTHGETTTVHVATTVPALIMPPLGPHAQVTVPLSDHGVLARGAIETAQVCTVSGEAGDGGGAEAYADIEVLLPAGRAFEVSLGAGLCRLEDVQGTVHVYTGGAELRAQGLRGLLEVRAATGDAKIRQFRGSLEVHTMSGDVSLYDTETDKLVATSDEGALRGAFLRTTMLAMHADQGSLALHQVRASDVALTTNAGDLDVTITSDVSVMSLRAKLGTIRLTMPETVNVTVQASSPFGRVTHDLPLEESQETHTGLVGRLGTGVGRAFVEATAGDIILERLQTEDDEDALGDRPEA